jgi:hypothetical protein
MLVRIQILISVSVPLTPDPAPTPIPTLFFSDFKEAKKIILFFCLFFLITYPQAHYLQSFKKIIFC